jgi:hypothetical protein
MISKAQKSIKISSFYWTLRNNAIDGKYFILTKAGGNLGNMVKFFLKKDISKFN